MNGTRVLRRPRRARPRSACTAAAIIATAALALLAAACGGGPSSAGSGGSPSAEGATASPSAVGYSRCMRAHGVPNYPDPPSGGQAPKADPQQLGISTSQLQAAQRSCRYMYPGNGGALGASLRQCEETANCPQAMVDQVMASMLAFPGACAPTACRTGPTPHSIPGGARASISSPYTAPTGIRHRSKTRSTNAST